MLGPFSVVVLDVLSSLAIIMLRRRAGVMQLFVSFLVLLSSCFGRELFALLCLSDRYLVTVKSSVSFHHSAVGRSAVCDCGISWSYLFYKINIKKLRHIKAQQFHTDLALH